ncbi:hypothetical protein F4561_006274 [Lipingzhangella halophila]|uniref:Helix-turn-helix protein n=1 Tax=Lipingzhangella halophila TaxID=1783352 RepID=A0A7W7RNS1_9ACTN|nr:hypothetical protein [Lipingzhangella halophila]
MSVSGFDGRPQPYDRIRPDGHHRAVLPAAGTLAGWLNDRIELSGMGDRELRAVGARLRELRTSAGWSINNLAYQAGVAGGSSGGMFRVLNGPRPCPLPRRAVPCRQRTWQPEPAGPDWLPR